MPQMPAVCDTCNTIFNSGFYFESAKGVTLSGNTSGPCPNCGNIGHVPDGIYNFVGNAVEILNAPERTIQELQVFTEILRTGQKNNETPEKIQEKVDEKTPKLSSFVNSLLATNNESFNIWLNFILSMILLLAQNVINDNPEPVQPTEIEINNVINNISTNTFILNQNQTIVVGKIGRNDLCPCGSEIKYKRCHGHYENKTVPY